MTVAQQTKFGIEDYIEAGKQNQYWYEESYASAVRWCAKNNFDTTKFISAVAILSPRVQLIRNVKLAKQWFAERDATSMMTQRIRALLQYDYDGTVSGTKVNDFRNSLLLVPDTVTIDIHMSRIFGYQKGELMRTSNYWSGQRNLYKSVVRMHADHHNMTTYGMQACMWCGYLKLDCDYTDDRFAPMDFSD